MTNSNGINNINVLAVTQARVGSTRLPGKVLLSVDGNTLLDLHLTRVQQASKLDKLFIATTVQPEDSAIEQIAQKRNLPFYRGSVDDVLDRFYQTVKREAADYVVRLTSDCPLIDPLLIDKVVTYAVDNKLDYCSNTLDPHYPDGQDIEVFTFAALENAWRNATLSSEREHVTPYIWKNSSYKGGTLFRSDNFEEGVDFGNVRMTVDELSDFEVIKTLIEQLGSNASWMEYATYIQDHGTIRALNEKINRNEGYKKSTEKD